MKDRSAFLVPHTLHVIGVGMETASHLLSDEKDLKKELRLAGALVGVLAAITELGMVFGQKNTDDGGHKAMAVTKAALTIIKFCLAIAEYIEPEDTKESKAYAKNIRKWHQGFTAVHGLFAVGHAAHDINTLVVSRQSSIEKMSSPESMAQPPGMVR